MLAISQVTELGTTYAVDEIAAMAELAHASGQLLFVDGARLANAAASLGCSLRAMTLEVGVDALTFGGTKNGLLFGEAVVFLRPELARRARYARKQAGQLASKMRFISAQFEALLTDELWLQNADHANGMATKLAREIAEIPDVKLLYEPAQQRPRTAPARGDPGASELVVLLDVGRGRRSRALDDELRDDRGGRPPVRHRRAPRGRGRQRTAVSGSEPE